MAASGAVPDERLLVASPPVAMKAAQSLVDAAPTGWVLAGVANFDALGEDPAWMDRRLLGAPRSVASVARAATLHRATRVVVLDGFTFARQLAAGPAWRPAAPVEVRITAPARLPGRSWIPAGIRRRRLAARLARAAVQDRVTLTISGPHADRLDAAIHRRARRAPRGKAAA